MVNEMAVKNITSTGILLRFVFAVLLVFSTYNPEGYSYFHWALLDDVTDFTVLQAFVGVVLLIGWAMYIRATIHSLGAVGLVLAIAFFGTLLWLIVDMGIVPAGSVRAISWLVLLAMSGVLTAGMAWSHIRRRVSGQVDVDEVHDNE